MKSDIRLKLLVKRRPSQKQGIQIKFVEQQNTVLRITFYELEMKIEDTCFRSTCISGEYLTVQHYFE